MCGTPPKARASSALSQREKKTRHWASVSVTLAVGLPYQMKTIRPDDPAATLGSAELLVSGPSLTRTGRDQVGVSLVLRSVETE